MSMKVNKEEYSIEEIPVERAMEFFTLQMKYLIDDKIITDEEEIEYFEREEYRGVIKAHMVREIDRHHMVYIKRDEERIGAAQYNTYQSQDGKCFILDYWVFPPFRGNGTGHRAFEALKEYTEKDGAKYYRINAEKDDSIRFWKSLGFIEDGIDDYGVPLFIKK